MKLWEGGEYPTLLAQVLEVLQDLECALVSASAPRAGESGYPPGCIPSSGMARLGLVGLCGLQHRRFFPNTHGYINDDNTS